MPKETANERFRAAAQQLGLDPQIQKFPEDTRTAAQAAAAIGCDVAQIVKSLIFTVDGEPVLVLTSGANQVATDKLGALLGGEVGRADAANVRDATGYAIGGVPPFGHATALRTVLDADLLGYDLVWGAAGTPDTVFPIEPGTLSEVTGATTASVAAD